MKTVFAKDRFPTDWKASRNGYTLKVWNVPHNYTMIAIVLTVGMSHRSQPHFKMRLVLQSAIRSQSKHAPRRL